MKITLTLNACNVCTEKSVIVCMCT